MLCQVPLGIAAANKQTSILMNMEYQVTLNDHSYCVAGGHKLIPSGQGVCTIDDSPRGEACITQKGPTSVRIRSAKHDSATCYDHVHDLHEFVTNPMFAEHMKYGDRVKPIIFIRTDGGPDQNLKHQTTMCSSSVS